MGSGIRRGRAGKQSSQSCRAFCGSHTRACTDAPMVAVKPPWFVRAPEALDTLRTMLVARYPTLHTEKVDGRILIRGSFSISHQGTALDWYLIELSLHNDYPMS